MAAGIPQSKEKECKEQPQWFLSLSPQSPTSSFQHILFVRNESRSPAHTPGEGNSRPPCEGEISKSLWLCFLNHQSPSPKHKLFTFFPYVKDSHPLPRPPEFSPMWASAQIPESHYPVQEQMQLLRCCPWVHSLSPRAGDDSYVHHPPQHTQPTDNDGTGTGQPPQMHCSKGGKGGGTPKPLASSNPEMQLGKCWTFPES